jgi:hypothetical protein
VRPGPLPGDELPVPTRERLWADQERTPRLQPKRPTRGREERLVGCSVDPPLHLPAEDHDLVSEDGDLELRLGRCALIRPEHAEDSARQEIKERADHGAALSQIEPPKPLSGHDRVSGPHGRPQPLVHAVRPVRRGDYEDHLDDLFLREVPAELVQSTPEPRAVTAPCTPRGQCGATGAHDSRTWPLICVVPTGFEPVSPP